MAVKAINTGEKVNGAEILRYVILNRSLEVGVLTYGATIQFLKFKGRDMVLGFDTVADYTRNSSYQGATIGRYANRIKNAAFTLNGFEYRLANNERNSHLHGGNRGFDKHIWEVTETGASSVTMCCVSPDGEENYPGNLKLYVTFSVSDSKFSIEYRAVSDKDTPINFTNHSYFNLSGIPGADMLDTELTIYSDTVCEIDNEQVPTGKLLNISGTPLDFSKGKEIGKDIDADFDLMKIAGGFDHAYVLGNDRRKRTAATAYSPKSGIQLECVTDLPAIQLYTSNFLNEKAGKNGIPLFNHQGFCLETNFAANSVNIPDFPSTILKAGEEFNSLTSYIFSEKG